MRFRNTRRLPWKVVYPECQICVRSVVAIYTVI